MIRRMMVGIVSLSLMSIAAVAIEGKAPDFTLKDIDGKEHALSDFEGKYVALEWTNYDCPFVKKHYADGHMQKLQKRYTDKGVVWLSINSSAPGKQGNFDQATWKKRVAGRGASPTAVLLEPSGKVGKAYGASNTPHVFVIDPEGMIIYQGAIDNTPSWKGAPSKAKNYVAAALDAAMAGKPVEPARTKPYGCSVKY